MRRVHVVKLTAKQRRALARIVALPSNSAGLARQARVVFLSAAEESGVAIAGRLDLATEQVSRIRRRFCAEGVVGLLAITRKPGNLDVRS